MYTPSFINLSYMIGLIIASAIHLRISARRRQFALRLIFSIILCCGISFLIPDVFDAPNLEVILSFLTRFLQFVLLIVCSCFCFSSEFPYILTRSIFGSITLLISVTLSRLITLIFGFDTKLLFTVCNISSFILVAGLFFFFSLLQDKGKYIPISNTIAHETIIIILGAIIAFLESEFHLLNSDIASMIFTILISFLVFTLINLYADEKRLKIQFDFMKTLREREKKQYQISKDLIDSINLKCHDLRHQIRDLRDSNKVISNEVLKDLENNIDMYDAAIKTGNDALDIILFEKTVFCVEHKIRISCIADGKLLSFMKGYDLYSLFGNLIDNAINAVLKIKEELRTINLTVENKAGTIFIRCQNYYGEEIKFQNGFPLTNQNKQSHGFGTKSIDTITKKYNGIATFKTKDNNIFIVDIIIPLENKK